MKDPLDLRDDPYQRFNAEGQAQGKPPQVTMQTKPMEVRRIFGPLRARAKDPARLQEAYDKLTRVEQRLEEDILFYWVPRQTMEGDSPAEPPAACTAQVPLPSSSMEFALVTVPKANDAIPPIQFREVTLTPLSRYDATELAWEVEFAR